MPHSADRRRRWAPSWLGLLGAALVAVLAVPVPAAPVSAAASAGPPQLYYTINSPPQLKAVQYRANGDQLRVGTPRVVANLPAADGLAAAPDGDLLVGGSKTGLIFKVNPHTGAVSSQPSGISTAYHITVSPDGSRAWTAGLPGQLAWVPLKPFGPGTAANVTGDERVVTTIGFTPNATFYTASTSYGSGDFGTIDLTTFRTKLAQRDLRGAHGFVYDPFSKDIFLLGSYSIVQIDPAHPESAVSQRTVSDMAFDQGTADGHGHLLAASNTGWLVLVDYSATGLVGDKNTVVSKAFLDTNLDDLLPDGPFTVSAPVATKAPAKTSKTKKLAPLIGLIVIIGMALIIVRGRQSSKRST